MGLSDLANASYEKRQQNIMKLRRLFETKVCFTVPAAASYMGYSRATIISWCKAGDIPLIDPYLQTSVVEITAENSPKWM